MNARELISWSFYLSGVVARRFDTVEGNDIKDGLTLLNDILADRNSDGRYLPYYDTFQFPAVVGQEEYLINNLVEIETLTVTLENVRYYMQWVGRAAYFGDSRVNGIKSIPFTYHADRGINQETHVPCMRIWAYWEPSQSDYVFEVVGRFSLASVTLDTNISNSLEGFYIDYLKYKLAQRICHFYGVPFNPQLMQELLVLEDKCDDVSPIDTTIQKMNPFGSSSPLNWGDVNIGHLWRPF